MPSSNCLLIWEKHQLIGEVDKMAALGYVGLKSILGEKGGTS